MRILVWDAGLASPASAYRSWYVDGMGALGHQVIAVDAHALASVFGLQGLQQLLLDYARAYRVTAALVPANAFVEPWFCQALRQLGVAVVRIRFDDCMTCAPGKPYLPRYRAWQLTYLDPHCHLAATCARHAPEVFARHGLPVPVYVPHPVGWQAIPVHAGPKRPVVSFAGAPKQGPGQPESWRVKAVRALLAAGLPVELHHDEWQTIPGCEAAARPTPRLADFHRLLGEAQVNLSLASDGEPAPSPQLRLLTLEIAAAGGMQIAYACDELDDYFERGRDIETFTTLDELVTKVRRYLADPEAAQAMGAASRRAVVRSGGWDVWWQRVAALLGDRGQLLRLDDPPTEPDPAFTPSLRLAATALAHLYEANDRQDLASVYYQEVLTYAADDHAALTGLARLAGDRPQALAYWQQAVAGTDVTLRQSDPALFGLPGVGEGYHTAYRLGAIVGWLGCALRQGDGAGLLEAIDALSGVDPLFARNMALHLAQQGSLAEAVQVCDSILRRWDDDADTLTLRAGLWEALGQAAAADRARAEAIFRSRRQP